MPRKTAASAASAEELNYHQLSERLGEAVARLENPETDIDAAVEAYEQGRQLIARIEAYLQTAEHRIERIDSQGNGRSTANG